MRTNKKARLTPDKASNPDSILNPHRFGYKLQETPHGFALTKTVKRDLHFYRRLKGWGVSVKILEWALEQGIDCLVINVEGEGQQVLPAKEAERFLSNLDYWIEHEGYETQVVIPERFWTKEPASQLKLF